MPIYYAYHNPQPTHPGLGGLVSEGNAKGRRPCAEKLATDHSSICQRNPARPEAYVTRRGDGLAIMMGRMRLKSEGSQGDG